MPRPPLPPFTAETAAQKARLAEDAWNTRDPSRVALAYTVDSAWRNRAKFIHGRKEIEAFLTRKWNRELDYRLIKECDDPDWRVFDIPVLDQRDFSRCGRGADTPPGVAAKKTI